MLVYQVKSGDTLESIAFTGLGEAGSWPVIYAANRDAMGEEQRRRFPESDIRHRRAPSPDWIFPGQALLLPEAHEIR